MFFFAALLSAAAFVLEAHDDPHAPAMTFLDPGTHQEAVCAEEQNYIDRVTEVANICNV